MNSRVGLRLVGLALLTVFLARCERRPKRTLRTEPWPAPAVSSAGPARSGPRVRYVVERGQARLDLRGKKAKPEAIVSELEGVIELDFARFERSSASLGADLLSLSFSNTDADSLRTRAFEWLELTQKRPAADRERDRWARLEITGLTAPPGADDGDSPHRRGRVTAHGTLTLHHFRVPVELELDVEIEPYPVDKLVVKTARPFLVSLAAHDILPRDAEGRLAPSGPSALGSEVAREARISAEITARPVKGP